MTIFSRFRMLAAMAALGWAATFCNRAEATIVRFETVMGNFDVRLFDSAMPRTVANFLHYVSSNKYNGTAVHRNSDTRDTPNGPLRDFVIQGGGFSFVDPTPPNTVMSFVPVATIAPIDDEPGGGVAGLSNLRGTIAMAKSGPDTVTSQWFINQGDNSVLDSPARPDGGFSAFGAVLGNGMSVVDAIGDLPLPNDFGFSIAQPFNDLPLRNFSGNSISQVRVQHTVTVTRIQMLNLPAGDYDFNGVVNAEDYAVWRRNFNSTTDAAADGNGNGKVDSADFIVWRNSMAGGAASGSVQSPFAAPEPSAVIMIAAASLLLVGLRGRSRRVSRVVGE
ncbi:MAG TPA: peptidylprolyl isomerase [Lacipirellulaceae bacterium]|nr:peptidylprolyl isomerase [Lacipirellulaceae bacterium]